MYQVDHSGLTTMEGSLKRAALFVFLFVGSCNSGHAELARSAAPSPTNLTAATFSAPTLPSPASPPTKPAAETAAPQPIAQETTGETAPQPGKAHTPPEKTPAAQPQGPAPLFWAQLTAASLPIRAEPKRKSSPLGTLRRGMSFPVYQEVETGSGCKGPWYQVSPDKGWVCAKATEKTTAPPASYNPYAQALPFSYATLFRDSEIYRGPNKRTSTKKVRKQRSTLSILEQEGKWTKVYPDEWYPTRLLIPRELRTYRLQGIELTNGLERPVAFARYRGVKAFQEPRLSRKQQRKIPEEDRVDMNRFDRAFVDQIDPPNHRYGGHWLKLEDLGWVERRRVSVATLHKRPSGIDADEKWLHVDLSEQTMVAYEGDQPVYATMVSTGKEGEKTQTPEGKWRIYHKLRSSRMAGGTGASYHYLSDVPWVQYFHRGYALHGVYWHNSFGWLQSQGCINLTPADAVWFFAWTTPSLSAGWYSLLNEQEQNGTWVVIKK